MSIAAGVPVPPHIFLAHFVGICYTPHEEYERWRLCGAVNKVMGAWQYDDEDLARLDYLRRKIEKANRSHD